MDTVKVTYIGPSNRRRARGKTESYWFGRRTSRHIPASDVEAVTSHDPENWSVEWPKVVAPTQVTTPPVTPIRRGKRRGGAATRDTHYRADDVVPVKEK